MVYGVQNGAANLLLYVGLGTMCVGMIIAFVGTGEKGFKTMELRLIGPSLIGAGVLIIILRILLCVCPSKCLQLKKQKHKLKNSTNKLNSEGNRGSRSFSTSGEQIDGGTVLEKPSKRYDGKKRVSIAMLPTTSGLSTNFPPSSHSFKPLKPPLTYQDNANQISAPAISFFENEKPTSSKSWCRKSSKHHLTSGEEDKTEGTAEIKFELKELRTNDLDAVSYESQSSCGRKFSNLPESLVTLDTSDLSITSVVNGYPVPTPPETKTDKIRTSSKFETARSPKNLANSELVLSPSTLNECNETD